MIEKIQLGEKCKDVLLLKFGTGDIMFSGIKAEGIEFALSFHEEQGPEIGATTEKYKGMTTDELPETKLIMQFTRPDSITALVHSLIELQQDMFDKARTQ